MSCIELKGQKIGRLTILSRAENDKRGEARWLCLCVCGVKTTVLSSHLRSRRIRSCGCFNDERRKIIHTTHGLSKHYTYRLYKKIKERCYSENCKCFHRYGGRGIKMCDKWLSSFEAFYSWCLSNGWEKGLQIDRRDNNGNYCPENCRFVSRIINARNNSRSRIWYLFGRKFETANEASMFFNVNPETIRRWCLSKDKCFSELKYKRSAYGFS